MEFSDCSKQVGLFISLVYVPFSLLFSSFRLVKFTYISLVIPDFQYSLQVHGLESQFLKPDCFRDDLAKLLRAVQEQEKQKLELVRTTFI